MIKLLSTASLMAALAAPSWAETKTGEAELIATGEKIFRKCKACHQIGADAQHRTGPGLVNIVDANAGQAEGYRYSKAMRAAAKDGLVWIPEELTNFLADPNGYMKGTKMKFPGLRKPAEIEAVIAYLGAQNE